MHNPREPPRRDETYARSRRAPPDEPRAGEPENRIGPTGSRRVAAGRHSYRRRRTSRDSTYVINIRPTGPAITLGTRATPALEGCDDDRDDDYDDGVDDDDDGDDRRPSLTVFAHYRRVAIDPSAATDERTNERPPSHQPRADTAVQLTPVRRTAILPRVRRNLFEFRRLCAATL